ncbi:MULTISPECIES: hypothetical protein [Pseudomonas]|uniref:Cell invasion protein n=1 Tax=Pseudomonas fluorescens TaxID=294 RepID=A0A5E6QU21_PSEFL|nr:MULTISPECIES: hypothetical protein [Pseudomonas]VVM58951.1 hypothetical protein PS652_01188 [Pseudomonas fluorescens]
MIEKAALPTTQRIEVDGAALSSWSMGKSSITSSLESLNLLAQVQVPPTPSVRLPDETEVERMLSTDAWSSQEKAMVLEAFKQSLDQEARDSLVFDPGAWEKHVNVLILLVIAQNVARVVNAALKGVFIGFEAKAIEGQAQAIRQAGLMQMYSAIAQGAVVTTMSGVGTAKSIQGINGRHQDISTNKRQALDANTVASDLRLQRNRQDFEPGKRNDLQVLDAAGKPKTHEFVAKGKHASPEELAWFDGEIVKAEKQARLADWNSAMSEKNTSILQQRGQQLSTMASVVGQAVGGILRTVESSARAEETRQQGQARLGKGLSDEVSQKDGADASLLNKIMEIFMQIMQSRAAALTVR